MRDIFLVVAIAIIMIAALRKPQIGILGWLWLSIMSPHRLAYGFIYSIPVLDGLVGVTILSCLMHWKERRGATFQPVIKLLLCFYLWCTLTTIFAVDFFLSLEDWLDFSKSLLLVACMMLFMNKKHWIIACCAVYIISIGFYGVKGGVFTITTGGGSHVLGAPGTDWGDNNGMSLALLTVMPLTVGMVGLFIKKWQKLSILALASSFFVAILGTQSRGGLIGLTGMVGMILLRSQRKILWSFLIGVLAISGYAFMPQSWHDRMETITSYEEQGSAKTRMAQWEYAIDISMERPLFGNGFDAFFYQPYYLLHVADKDKNRAVHSNYFQVIGEQGFIGLFMYLGLIISVVRSSKKEALKCKGQKNLEWASTLLMALQFSVIGYAVNGLTVNTAYLDLFYYLIAINVLLISYIRYDLSDSNTSPLNHKRVSNNGP